MQGMRLSKLLLSYRVRVVLLLMAGAACCQAHAQGPAASPAEAAETASGAVFPVDRYPAAGGRYAGDWSSAASYGACETVSYQGAEWITPEPVRGAAPSGGHGWIKFTAADAKVPATQADCAFFAAYGFVASHARNYDQPAGADLEFGAHPGGYPKNGDWMLPINPYGYTISMHGKGRSVSFINQTTSTTGYMVTQYAVHGQNIISQDMTGISFNANLLAGGCLALHGVRRSSYRGISCINPQQQPGGAVQAAMFIGYQGDSYEISFDESLVRTRTFPGARIALAKANVDASGGITSYTITDGGAKLNTALGHGGPGLVTYWLGHGPQGDSQQPCKVMPDQPTYTLDPGTGALTGLQPGANKGSGCGGVIYVRVHWAGTIPYGWFFGGTDSTFRDIVTSGDFKTACQFDVHGSNFFLHEHPYCWAPVQVRSDGRNYHQAVELDSPIEYGLSLEGPDDIVSSYQAEWNGKTYPGAGDVLIGPRAVFNTISASGCGSAGNQSAGGYAKYTEAGKGPITPSAPLPIGFAIEGSQPNCDGSQSNWGSVLPGATAGPRR